MDLPRFSPTPVEAPVSVVLPPAGTRGHALLTMLTLKPHVLLPELPHLPPVSLVARVPLLLGGLLVSLASSKTRALVPVSGELLRCR